MPTFGHLFFGLCILIPILYYTKNENQFSYKIAFIFFVNNIFGPDCVALFFITPFHNILGFLILAIPLSLVFSYSSRFSMVKSEEKFPLKIVDDEIREVNWKNAYCATAAGGFTHFFVDQFFHWEKEMHVWPGIDITHDQMLAWSGVPYHYVTPLMIIGDILVITVLLLSFYFFKKGYKETSKLLLISTVISILLMVILSPLVFMGEREYAVMVAITVYFFIPLFLLMYAARDVKDNPRKTPDVPKIKRKTLLNIVAIISMIVALFFILYSYFAITYAETIASLITEDEGGDNSAIVASVLFIGYFFLVFSVLLFIGSIGLFFKIKICRHIVMFVCSYFIIFGFPIAITFFLCEKDVKAMFYQISDD